MNIFASSSNPEESAAYLDDKRVIKMVLESAQLLSTAINECGGRGPYKTTHKNHPCSVWCRTTSANYNWLLEHFKALCSEYSKRYNKIHKCEVLLAEFKRGINLIPSGKLTTFPNCTIFKEISNPEEAYKKYLDYKWQNDKRIPKWNGYTQQEKQCLKL